MRSESLLDDGGARRWAVRLIMLFYAALLAEGVLRKWVVPEASNALVFLRDPVMALILLAYLRTGVSDLSRGGLRIGAVGLAALVLCAACQAASSALPWLVLLAGFRNYAFFVPLCFAIRDCFRAEDYARWLKLNLLIAVPVGMLVVLQYVSPPTATINAVPGGGNDGVFLVVEDVVRPYGLFSFALGHSAYAAWMAGISLAAFVGQRSLRLSWWLIGSGTIGTVVMGAFSGSRTYVLLAAAVFICFFAIALLCGPARSKRAAFGAAAGLLSVATAVLVLVPDVLTDLQTRQATAVASEGSTLDRIMLIVTGFASELGAVPLFGYGLGAGTNIGTFLTTGGTDRLLAEYELTRIVQELGPVFGCLYIGLRWAFLGWLALMTVQAARHGNLQPACYLGLFIPVFLAHDITLQNTMIGIGWFSAGILMNAAKLGTREVARSASSWPNAFAGAPA